MKMLPVLALATVFFLALSNSVSVAVFTAVIAGVFSVINTVVGIVLNRKLRKIHNNQRRVLELTGERDSDKPNTDLGRNRPVLELDKDRRES